MNENDSEIDLSLSLGSRKYTVETRLHSSLGAGVNASSRVDMPFAASDPLSELVWSPHNGVSLKRTNSSLVDKRPFLMWNVGVNVKDIATSQSIRSKGSGDIKISDEEKICEIQTMLDGAGNCDDQATMYRSSGGCSSFDLNANQSNHDAGKMEENGTTDANEDNYKGKAVVDVCSSKNVEIAERRKQSAELLTSADGKSDMGMNWKFPYNLMRGTHFNQNDGLQTHASRSDFLESAIPIRSEPFVARASEALACSLQNLQSPEEPDDEAVSASRDVNKNTTEAPIPIPAPTLMTLESSAENDLGNLDATEVCSSGGTGLPRENNGSDRGAPTDSKFCLYRVKGKGKASSDGDVFARSSNNEDDSNGSMESCNSTGLFSKGVKRRNVQQAQLIRSKRMRKKMQVNCDSKSDAKRDSSFMNWISNMVKGLSDYNKDYPSPLALTLAHSNNVCSDSRLENYTLNETTDSTRQWTGFQTVFQSLYHRSTKTSNSVVLKDNQTIAESRELVVADEKSHENRAQSCDETNDDACKQIILSDKEVVPLVSWVPSADLDSTPCERAKGEVSPSLSLCEKMNISSEKTSLEIPLPMSYLPGKSSPFSSLWITRLYTRTARLEHCNQDTEEARDFASKCRTTNVDCQANNVVPIDQKMSEAGDECDVHNSEHEMLGYLHKTSRQTSQKLVSSVAMASVFAKRLDALKHIIQSPLPQLVCFFCGRRGHDIRQCPKITETELQNLLVKISSLDRIEESPCLCIRCFQLNHWAISCPLVSSHNENRRSEQEEGAIDHYTTSRLQLRSDDKCSSYIGEDNDDQKAVLGSFCNYQTWNVKESSSKRPTSNVFLKSTSSSSDHHLKDNQTFPPRKIISAHDALLVEEMFHAIRKLRLSRADIIRWANSNVPLLHLNGFFLRLKVGKIEGGVEGTNYYVASITGDEVENVDSKSQKSIMVDVGGVKSSVGSQYISNHDFLEDEIKAWWSRTVKNGCKIPSLDELKSKFEHRKRLNI